MNVKELNSQSGFTLIELMIATVIFSIVLMVILASFMQVGRLYYKGTSVASTNEAARGLVDNIATDLHLAHTTPIINSGYFCIGQHRYTYKLGQQVTDSDTTATASTVQAGVILDNIISGCPDPSSSGTNPQQLLGVNMQLNKFVLNCTQQGNGVCDIDARVLYYGVDNTVFVVPDHPDYTPDQALTDPAATCSGSLLSSQLCAVSEFETDALIDF